MPETRSALESFLEPTAAEANAAWNAQQVTLQACMKAEGFQYIPESRESVLPIEDIPSPSRRRSFQFNIRFDYEAPRKESPNRGIESSLVADELSRYKATLEECRNSARIAAANPPGLLAKMSSEEIDRRLIESDTLYWQRADVQGLVKKYAACMTKAGYKVTMYSVRSELFPVDFAQLSNSSEYRSAIFQREMQVAEDDAKCMDSVYPELRRIRTRHNASVLADIAEILSA
jgi:hypothetical protein